MGILGYQLAIGASLIVVRLVAPKRLLGAALFWTVLSIVNLFWPPLIALQLITVWVTYGVIAPSAGTPDKGKPARPPGPLGSVNPFIDAMNTAFDEMHATISLESEIQEATRGLQMGYDLEHARIRSILERSKERLSTDRQRLAMSEDLRKLYDAKRAEIGAAIEKSLSELKESMGEVCLPPPQISLTDLTAPKPRSNPEVKAAVQRHHASIVREYSKFLADVLTRLQGDKDLRAIFEAEMNADSPALLWRIECFEAGGDWRSVASVERGRDRRRIP